MDPFLIPPLHFTPHSHSLLLILLCHIPFPPFTHNRSTMYRVAASHGAFRRIGHVAPLARPTHLLATLPARTRTTPMIRSYEGPWSCLPTQPTQLLRTKKAPTNINSRRRFTTETQETTAVEEEVNRGPTHTRPWKPMSSQLLKGRERTANLNWICARFSSLVVATSIRLALL